MTANESLGTWATQNPLLAVALVVLIIGVVVGVVTLARRDRNRDSFEDDGLVDDTWDW